MALCTCTLQREKTPVNSPEVTDISGLFSALVIFTPVNHERQPRLCADNRDEFIDSKPGALCGYLAAPENGVNGGHLLSRP